MTDVDPPAPSIYDGLEMQDLFILLLRENAAV